MRSNFVCTVSEALTCDFNAWSKMSGLEIYSLVSHIHDENSSL